MQQWKYDTTHIFNVRTHIGVAQPHVAAALT